MKPRDENRIYCIGAGRRKLVFETEEKANRHIQWANKDPDLEKKLERSYYCPFCLGWHVTSVKSEEGYAEETEKKMDFYLRKTKIEVPGLGGKTVISQEVPMIHGFFLDKSRELKELGMTLNDWQGIEGIRRVLQQIIHQTSGPLRCEIENGMGKLRERMESLKGSPRIVNTNISEKLEELESLRDIEKLKWEIVELSLYSDMMTDEEKTRLEKLNEKLM